jgi:hypothetical protein
MHNVKNKVVLRDAISLTIFVAIPRLNQVLETNKKSTQYFIHQIKQ